MCPPLALDRHYAAAYFEDLAAPRVQPSSNTNPSLVAFKPDYAKTLHANHHGKELERLHTRLRAFFPEFRAQLECGFKLVLFGYGSKIDLVDEFAETFLDHLDCYTVYAHRQVDEQDIPASVARPTALVVHNFHRLAAHIRSRLLADSMLLLVATVNGELAQSENGDLLYHDFTTYTPYTVDELRWLAGDSLAKGGSSESNVAGGSGGARFVLQSLTSNARQIFCILAEWQLLQEESREQLDENTSGEEATASRGLPEHVLYQKASEQLLVSSELAFRSLLTEFVDHELVVELNGGLSIPLGTQELRQLLATLQ